MGWQSFSRRDPGRTRSLRKENRRNWPKRGLAEASPGPLATTAPTSHICPPCQEQHMLAVGNTTCTYMPPPPLFRIWNITFTQHFFCQTHTSSPNDSFLLSPESRIGIRPPRSPPLMSQVQAGGMSLEVDIQLSTADETRVFMPSRGL
jgi:hypothetical protein